MKTYNHAYTVAFSLLSPHDGENVTEEELLSALEVRLDEFRRNKGLVVEACGMPFDTFIWEGE